MWSQSIEETLNYNYRCIICCSFIQYNLWPILISIQESFSDSSAFPATIWKFWIAWGAAWSLCSVRVNVCNYNSSPAWLSWCSRWWRTSFSWIFGLFNVNDKKSKIKTPIIGSNVYHEQRVNYSSLNIILDWNKNVYWCNVPCSLCIKVFCCECNILQTMKWLWVYLPNTGGAGINERVKCLHSQQGLNVSSRWVKQWKPQFFTCGRLIVHKMNGTVVYYLLEGTCFELCFWPKTPSHHKCRTTGSGQLSKPHLHGCSSATDPELWSPCEGGGREVT